MRTPRPHARTRRAAAVLVIASAGLMSLAGCDPRTILYFLQPYEPTIAAPGPSLKGKKVVIVTHAVSNALGEFPTLDRDLASEIVRVLRAKDKKIEIVPPDKINTWVDAHPNWTDPEEIAKAFEADVVVFLEVEGFTVQNAGDLNVLQGTAKTHIQVTEIAHPTNSKGKPDKSEPKEPKMIYNEYCETEFPVRGPMPADSGVSRSVFKSKFLKVVAAEITWHFVEHSPEDNIQDVKFK
jgi:hypothetical protein